MGAWIEIDLTNQIIAEYEVAPLMGAWIEMSSSRSGIQHSTGRAPHGRVD